jgi:SRSO17 transposase
VRPAAGARLRDGRHLPGDEVWLVGERRASGERRYYLSNLPAEASLGELAALIKARWVCEQAHQQLKEELGLDHFEGRSWIGLHRHALMTMIAFCFLQRLRLEARGKSGPGPPNGPPPQPTLPAVRRRLLDRFRLALARCPCCGTDLGPGLPPGVPR